MPSYGTAQAGANVASPGLNLSSIQPGDSYTLFDGTETPAALLASVAISRGPSVGGADNGITFIVSGTAAVSTTIDIEVSNTDVDGDYISVTTITPDASGNGAYTDVGRAAFYRAKLSAYSTGAMPVVKVQR